VRALQRLHAPVRAKLTAIIDALADDPRPAGCQKLAGSAKLFRVRAAGVYRIVYEVRDDVLTVVVIRLGHRRDVYRGL
jgi:mRNA interferase RelE/StbE